jgi:hypothetical protein
MLLSIGTKLLSLEWREPGAFNYILVGRADCVSITVTSDADCFWALAEYANGTRQLHNLVMVPHITLLPAEKSNA